jgi:hypothetical protein
LENKLHELRESYINLSLSFGGGRGFVHYLIFNEALTDGATLKIRRWAKSKKKITPASLYHRQSPTELD